MIERPHAGVSKSALSSGTSQATQQIFRILEYMVWASARFVSTAWLKHLKQEVIDDEMMIDVPKNRFQMVSTCFKMSPYISCASVKSGCAWIWGAFPRDCANAPQSGLCDCRTGTDSFPWEINPIWGKRVPAVPGNRGYWGYACHCLSKKLDSYGLIQFLAQVKGSQDFCAVCSL